MSDSSGPFAAPDFSRAAGAGGGDVDDELDEADDDLDDELDDAEDDELFDEDAVDDEDEDEELEPVADSEEDRVSGADDANVVDGGSARAVIEHVARSIVDEPDAVTVEVRPQRGGLRLELRVAPSDMGRIIGRRGRVAQALRVLVRAAAAKDGTDATVDIVD